VSHRVTRELLRLSEPPTANFVASGTQSLGMLEAAGFEGGLLCPRSPPWSASKI
jgi:hypothetical protein